jgi:hypothetical protein
MVLQNIRLKRINVQPPPQVSKSRTSVAFGDEECNRLIRRRKAALFKLKEFPTQENFLSYEKKGG